MNLHDFEAWHVHSVNALELENCVLYDVVPFNFLGSV